MARESDESDAELVRRVRSGDLVAYEAVYTRHHRAALHLARGMVDKTTADDVVADAFLKLLTRFQAGGGPNFAVRPYLLQMVRFGAIDARRRRREDPVDPGVDGSHRSPLDRDLPDVQDQLAENSLAHQALMSLPERQRAVLWLGEVEGLDRHHIAAALGVSAGAVSALALRARENLKRAYLENHLESSTSPEHARCLKFLPAFVRGKTSRSDTATVMSHLKGCASCTRVHDELIAINNNLAGFIAPALLGVLGTHQLGLAPVVQPIAPAAAISSQVAVVGAAASVAVITSLVVAFGVFATPGTVPSQAQARLEVPSVFTETAPSSAPTKEVPPPRKPRPAAPVSGRGENDPVSPSDHVGSASPQPQPTQPTQPTTGPEPTAPAPPIAVDESPSASPSPLPTVDSPPRVTHDDVKVAVGEARRLPYERDTLHLSLDVVSGSAASVVLDIAMDGLTGFAVHARSEREGWVCDWQTSTDDSVSPVRCVLAPETGSNALAIDLSYSGPPAGTVVASMPSNEDPDLSNNTGLWDLFAG